MMKLRSFRHISRVVLGLITLCGSLSFAHAEAESILKNSNLENDLNSDNWPDGWPKIKGGGSWEEEDGNRFLRMTSTEPGALVMMYLEVPIPADVQALELKWRQRVTGLQRGVQPWFDARIMLDWMNVQREKVGSAPPPVGTGRDTGGWETKTSAFLVPEGAAMLKIMPCLFNVKAGTLDIDDIELRPTDPAPIAAADREAAEAKAAKEQAATASAQAKAVERLAATGNLVGNGNFETAGRDANWPVDWPHLKEAGEWGRDEDGNRFVRMTAREPGKLTMLYMEVPIPPNTPALEVTWRWRLADVKTGAKPWFDARFVMEFMGAGRSKVEGAPAIPYGKGSTEGWVKKQTSFLVPAGATHLKFMPSLFQVASGTMDIDDVVIRPTGTEELEAAARLREEEARARYVAPEEPQREKWPAELKVQGNRLVTVDGGREVWLQGVNAGNLETLPHDKQVVKSVVVGIEEWKANAIRLPMKDSFWFGRSDYQKDGGAGYRETIDQIVTLAANRGAYVIIDLHRYRAPKAEYAEFWKDAATRYKNHPAVLFDLMNEPHGTSWEVWRNGGWVGEKEGVDESAFLTEEEKKKNQGFESIGMQALLDAVRSTGARNIVVVGGLGWAGDLSGVVKGYALEEREGGNGIMYSWHQYNWHKGWDKTVLPVAEKYPVLVGEVGADVNKMEFIPSDLQESPYTWVPDMLGFLQKHRLNWTGWCFHPKATPVLISDWKYTPTPFWGEFAKRALAGEQFEMKKMR